METPNKRMRQPSSEGGSGRHGRMEPAADAQLSMTLRAISDPTRRDIMIRLSELDASLNVLAKPYPMSVQAVTKHVRVLEGAGLVSRARGAQSRYIHLEAGLLDLVTCWTQLCQRQARQR